MRERRELRAARVERRRALAPAHEMRTERQAPAERRHQEQRAGPYPPLLQRLAQRHRHGCRRHVAVAFDVDVDAFHRHARAFGHRFDDAQVRLMRHDEIDVASRLAGAAQDVLARPAHAAHCLLEDLLALELPLARAVEAAGMDIRPAQPMNAQDFARLAVAAEFLDQQAFVAIGRFHDDGRRAVAEQHRDVAVVPIHVRRDELGPDHQRAPRDTASDHRARRGKAVEKARAGGVDVHRGAAFGPYSLLQP